ncbi:MAG: hypothetical protein ACKVWV_19520 [Planctomycetota bacterium]
MAPTPLSGYKGASMPMQLFPVLLLLAADAASGTKGQADLYGRVVDRALERAQANLIGATDLWVDHSRWENAWIVESERYQVRTTHSRHLALEIAQNLEYMHGEFVKLLGPGGPPPRKFRVWIFPELAAYNEFGNQRGAEHSSSYGSFYASEDPDQPVATYYTPNATLLGMWLTHAATHQYVEQCFARPLPLWASEGLASYFALFWDWSYGSRELRRIADGAGYVPLDRLLRDPIEAYVGGADVRFVELGMLFHYLLNHREDMKTRAGEGVETAPFRDYLRALVRGNASPTPPFWKADEQAVGLEQAFKAFDFSAR